MLTWKMCSEFLSLYPSEWQANSEVKFEKNLKATEMQDIFLMNAMTSFCLNFHVVWGKYLGLCEVYSKYIAKKLAVLCFN